MALTKVSGSILKDPLNLGEVSIGGTLTYEDVTNIDSIGIITARSGVAYGTGIGATISSPATNTLALGTDGTEKLRIEAGGNIGIGTNNPNNLLHVFGGQIKAQSNPTDTSTDLDLIRAQCGSTGNALFSIRAVDAADNNSDWDIKTNANENLTFSPGGSEAFRIDSGGRVGLGITNPSDYFSSYNRVVMGRTTDTGGMTIVSAPTSGGYIAFADGTSGNEAYRGQIAYYHSQDSMIFGTDGGTERLRINNKGHLGLNVTPGTWDNTFKALEGGGNSKHGELFFQANGDWTTALGCNLYFNSGWKYRHTGAANWLEMKEDRTTFYMADSGSADSAITWLERLRIQSAGYITMPYQIAFFAHCSIGNHDLDIGDKFQFNTIPSSGNVAVNSNHTTFGGTNVFNTSTNTFTAPVAGLYSFTVTGYYRRTGDPLGPLVPRVNNNEVSNGNNGVFFFANSSPTDGDTMSGTLILQLAVGDEVTVHRRNHGTGTLRFYGPHSHFCGHLIG